jgi:hypothetical protein
MMDYSDRLRAEDYCVADAPLRQVRELIAEHHYARGSSHTAVYAHGLYRKRDNALVGVAHWLPPTKPAAMTVSADWRRVLSLSRMVVLPGTPKNACSFLLSRSIKWIKRDEQWNALVTYADDRQGHDGLVYRSAGWIYVGKSSPTPAWLDPSTGRQVATLSTKTRTKEQMIALGYVCVWVASSSTSL